jgi:N-acetylneuraminic acid mutarotase
VTDIRSTLRRANERRRNVPMGVQLLTAFVAASIALVAVVAFGPELPGPNVSDLVTGGDETPTGPCDPRQDEVREPDQPVDEQGRWRREPPTPSPRDEVRAAAVGGRIFILNGNGGTDLDHLHSVSDALVFDPAKGTYSRVPDTPLPLDHAAVVTYRGDLYLVGGDSNGHSSGGLWRYSSDERSWETLPSMQTPRAGHAAGVIGDRLYVVGGTTDSTFLDVERAPLTSLEIYDFRTREWSRGPDMPTGRHHFDATVVDGQLYAIGGRTHEDSSLDAVERFDPGRGEWETLTPLPLGVSGEGVETVAGRVLVVAGGDDLEGWVTPATWAFDPRHGEWRRLPDVTVPRHGYASATVGDRIYIFTGAPCAGWGQTVSAESLSLGRG